MSQTPPAGIVNVTASVKEGMISVDLWTGLKSYLKAESLEPSGRLSVDLLTENGSVAPTEVT